MRPWVLIDLSYLAYRALHSVGFLDHEELPTGVIYGFFVQLRQVCENHRIESNRVAIFCDSSHSFRRVAFPAYKEKRRQEQDEEKKRQISILHDQIKVLREKILPDCGFPVYSQWGLESDDLMADAAKGLLLQAAFGPPLPLGVMITADSDLYQCITHAVHWYDPLRRIYYNPDSFEGYHGLPPHRWGEVKCIAGDSTDNVPGVPGVGKKTAVLHLQGKLNPKLKRAQSILSLDGVDIIQRNRELVLLPHQKTERVILREPEYDVKEFLRVCKRYGMESFRQDRKGWEAFFREPPKQQARKRKQHIKFRRSL